MPPRQRNLKIQLATPHNVAPPKKLRIQLSPTASGRALLQEDPIVPPTPRTPVVPVSTTPSPNSSSHPAGSLRARLDFFCTERRVMPEAPTAVAVAFGAPAEVHVPDTPMPKVQAKRPAAPVPVPDHVLQDHKRILSLRAATARALVVQDQVTLERLLQEWQNLQPTQYELTHTGITLLVNDLRPWRALGLEDDAAALKAAWTTTLDNAEVCAIQPPFRGLQVSSLMEVVDELESFLKGTRSRDIAPGYRLLAYDLALRNFDTPISLAGVKVEDCLFAKDEWSKATLSRALDTANELAARQQEAVIARLTSSELTRKGLITRADPEVVLRGFDAKTLDAEWKDYDEKLEKLGVDRDMKPEHVIDSMAKAAQNSDLLAELDGAAKRTMKEGRRGSLPSIKSGVRSWLNFGFLVLLIPMQSLLPPDSSTAVLRWLQIFNNMGTALNYLQYLVWICQAENLDLSWYDSQLKLWVRGARKLKLHAGLKQTERFLLTTTYINMFVRYFDKVCEEAWSILVLTAWSFLLRVASEALDIVAGAEDWEHAWPDEVSQALWVDTEGYACLKLRKRKHRPRGSFMRRPCTCKGSTPRFCFPHRLAKFLRGVRPGTSLWKISSSQLLRRLKGLLLQQAAPKADLMGLKAFRAGMATEMVKKGAPLRFVAGLGEWRTRAMLTYIDEDVVDKVAFIEASCDGSDREDELGVNE